MDGPDPRNWTPWGQRDRVVKTVLSEILQRPALGVDDAVDDATINMDPMVCGPDDLIGASVGPVVGLVVDPHGDRDRLLRYFRSLCRRLRGADAGYKVFGLSVWVLGEGDHSDLCSKFNEVAYGELGGSRLSFTCKPVAEEQRLDREIRQFVGTCHWKLLYHQPERGTP